MSDIDQGGPKQRLGVSSVFATGHSIMRNKPQSLILSAIIANLLLTASTYLISNAIYGLDITDLQAASLAINIGQLFIFVISMLGYGFMLALLTAMAYDAYNNAPIALGRSANLALRKMWLVAILIFIVYLIVVLPAAIIGVLASAVLPASVLVVVPVAFVLMLYLLSGFSVVTQVVVIEDIGFGALGRSIQLSKGYRWPIVGFCCLLFVIVACVNVLKVFILSVVSGNDFSNVDIFNQAMAGQFWLFQVINAALFGVLIAYFTCLGVALFARLTEIKEGWNDGALPSVFD